MKKRLFALLLALGMLTTMLSGCGNPAASAPSSEKAASVSSEEAKAPEEAPAPAVESSSAAEESVLEAETHEFAEGAGVFPIADGDKTITIFDGWFPFFAAFGMESYADTLFFQEMEQRTGIKTEFRLENAETAVEKFNLMIAGGDYCDLMHDVDTNYTGGLDTAWADDVIIAIDDLIDQWMPNYYNMIHSQDVFITDLTSNQGNIYQIAILKERGSLPDYGLQIRQDWLDDLGLERPKTYDEYYDVLTAFKNQKNASAPMMLSRNGSYQGNFFASGYGVKAPPIQMGSPFFQINGEVKYGPMEDGYKKYLTTLSKWYADGLIYKDFYTYVDSNTNPPDDLVLNNQMGLYGLNTQDIPNRYSEVVGNNPDIVVVGAYDPVENEGDTLHFSESRGASATGGYCISTHCEDPVLVARWADYIYSEEGQLLSNYGVEGLTFDYNAEGKPELNDMIFNNPDGLPEQLAITKYTTFSLVGVQDDYRQYARFTDAQWEAARDIWPLGDDAYVIPTGVQMTSEENTTYANAYSDIGTYVGQYTLQAIMGDVDIDATWGEYVAAIEAMNIATCIQQQQSALDRYNAA